MTDSLRTFWSKATSLLGQGRAANLFDEEVQLQPMTQAAQPTNSISQQVMFARLAGCFGVLAVALIGTGLYGTLAYRVNRRSAEIALRMALGAQRSEVVWMVLRGSLRVLS